MARVKQSPMGGAYQPWCILEHSLRMLGKSKVKLSDFALQSGVYASTPLVRARMAPRTIVSCLICLQFRWLVRFSLGVQPQDSAFGGPLFAEMEE